MVIRQLGTGRAVDAFVHVVDSPTRGQLFYGRTHGSRLTKALRVGDIRHWHRVVADIEALDLALGRDLMRAIRHYDALPLLHLSAQVSREGLELTDGTFLTLDEVSERLALLNRAMEGGLIVCMPGCHGTAAARMATAGKQFPPYYAIVGSHEDVGLNEAALGFAALYHRVLSGASIEDSIEALTAASGNISFYIQYSAEVRTVFQQRLPGRPTTNDLHHPPGAPPRSSP